MKNDGKGMIVFRNRETISRILDSLQEKTGLPNLFYSSKATGGQRTRGLGYLESVRKFYELLNVPWAGESWQGQERGY